MARTVSLYNELFVNNDWTDVTDHVDGSSRISIGRGYANENAALTPSRCSLTLNDPDGRYNRRNPLGLYYGTFNKGTSMRNGVKVVDDSCTRTETNTWGVVAGTDAWTNGASSGGTVNATDWAVSSGLARHSLPVAGAYRVSEFSKATRVFVDAEVRLAVVCPTNNVTGTGAIATEIWFRAQNVSNYTSAALAFNPDETVSISFYERTAGTNITLMRYTTIPGLSLSTATAYEFTAQIEGGTIRAKVWPAGTKEPLDWQVWASRATVRGGYLAVTSFVYAGNTNAFPLVVSYDNFSFRVPTFTGKIDTLSRSYSSGASGMVRTVDVMALGVLGRYGQGSQPFESPMRRRRGNNKGWLKQGSGTSVASVGSRSIITVTDADAADIEVGDFGYFTDTFQNLKEDQLFTVVSKGSAFGFTDITFTPDVTAPVAINDNFFCYRAITDADKALVYWPCEDSDNATVIASGLPDGAPMVIRYAQPRFRADNRCPGSSPIVKFNDAEIAGNVPDYPNTNQAFTLTFLVGMPDTDEAATGTDLIQFFTSGTGNSYDIQYEAASDGSLELLVFNAAGTLLFTTGTIALGLRGNLRQVIIYFYQSAPTVVSYGIRAMGATGSPLTGTATGTITGVTSLGKILRIAGNPGGGYKDVSFGQLDVFPFVDRQFDMYDDMIAQDNESVTRRLQRFCFEENVPFAFRHDLDLPSLRMGPQRAAQFVTLLQDAVDSDMGYLFEPKGTVGLEYASQGSLTNQPPFLTLSLAAGEVQPDFDPIDDNTNTRNEVVVSRSGGSSFTATESTGPMANVPEVLGGIGNFKSSPTIYTRSDAALVDQANWRLHLGTIDEDRYPKVRVLGARDSIPLETLFSVNVGYRIVVTGMSALDMYSDLSQLVLGYELTLDKFVPTFVFNCAPASPYRIFQIEDDEYGRYQDTDSLMASGVSSSGTTISVKSASGAWLWTTDATDFPFDIVVGGEVMRVTNITGASSPQSMTVVRSINGVTKIHVVDEPVEMARPVFYSM